LETIAHDVMPADAIADGEYRAVTAGPWKVIVARIGGVYHALNNRCSHAASPLDGGRMRGAMMACPLHGARFDLASGKCVGAAYPAIRTFPVSIENGRIVVAVPARAPEIGEMPITMRR